MKKLVQYFTNVRVELSRVQWPTLNDFVGATIVVIFIVALFTVFFGVVDKAISVMAQYIFRLGR